MGRIKAKGKVFRDPVHGLIRIDPKDEFLLDLIDTPEFQRLRRIQQLGVSFLTYHGAEHSRFAHSMGVLNFAQRIVKALRQRYKDRNGVLECIEMHERTLKAAALLHDVGHGPFSHMIERAFESIHRHEKKTVKLITEPESSLKAMLDRHDIDPEGVANIIGGTHECRLIVDIVSSQLDADRMDYLLRDSLQTGVEYGKHDAEWILNSLCIGTDPTAVNPGEGGWRLCLDRERGLYPAEQLIVARTHMTMQVYFHRVTRGFEVLLLNLFAQAAELRHELPEGTPGVVRRFFERDGELEHAEWLRFDEAALTAAFHAWADVGGTTQRLGVLRRLARAFLRREPVYQGVSVPKEKVGLGLARLGMDLTDAGLKEDMDWALDECKHLPYKNLLLAAEGGGERGDSEAASAESVLLSSGDPDERARPAEAESGLFKHFEPLVLPRLYYDRSKQESFRPVLERYGLRTD